MNAVNAARPEIAAIGPGSLRARMDLLLQRAITLENFEADVARLCQANPDEIWSVLALLDQYHRRGLLPTPLFRELKASADRRSLVRQGIGQTAPAAVAAPTPAESPIPAPEPEPVAAPIPMPMPIPTLAPALAAAAAAATPVPTIVPTATAAAAMPPAPPATSPPVGHSAPVLPGILPAGTVLSDRYVLEALLGRGSRSTVYRAVDRERSNLPLHTRCVALKILHTHVLAEAGALANLRVEFQCAQTLSHPNIVNVYELEQFGPTTFMTMELLDGQPLSALLERYRRQPLPRPVALAIIRDAGAALVHAHERGVVHGNLQPRHIMITSNGEVRVMNFAAARTSNIEPGPETNPYASCEALEGQIADRRDDLYALACISYELLAGHHPFNRLTAAQARGRALLPRRPALLRRGPWQALRTGLAWRRDNRSVGIGWWLARMNLGAAAAHLPALRELIAPPLPPRAPTLRPALLLTCLGAALAGAAALDRLPSRHRVAQAWQELRAANLTNPLRRLGDWLSPAPTATSPADHTPDADRRHALAVAAATSRRGPVGASVPAPPAPAVEAPAPAAPDEPIENTPATGAAAGVATRVDAREPPLPPTRIELAADNFTVLPGEPAVRIEVRRRGNLQGDVSFVWSTESASAQPERDFIASGRRAEQIPAGVGSVTLLVPIVSDAARTESRVFYVTIGEPGGGANPPTNSRASVLVAGGS
jgi:eukaryotic-like serine/threonine-protein kinase